MLKHLLILETWALAQESGALPSQTGADRRGTKEGCHQQENQTGLLEFTQTNMKPLATHCAGLAKT